MARKPDLSPAELRIMSILWRKGSATVKEIQTALYGDRFLNRGFAVLNIDGPGQYESPMLGIYFSMDNWVATGKAVCDWLAKRPEVDMGKVVLSGTSFGTFFGTIATAHEPRISAAAVISVSSKRLIAFSITICFCRPVFFS